MSCSYNISKPAISLPLPKPLLDTSLLKLLPVSAQQLHYTSMWLEPGQLMTHKLTRVSFGPSLKDLYYTISIFFWSIYN